MVAVLAGRAARVGCVQRICSQVGRRSLLGIDTSGRRGSTPRRGGLKGGAAPLTRSQRMSIRWVGWLRPSLLWTI